MDQSRCTLNKVKLIGMSILELNTMNLSLSELFYTDRICITHLYHDSNPTLQLTLPYHTIVANNVWQRESLLKVQFGRHSISIDDKYSKYFLQK